MFFNNELIINSALGQESYNTQLDDLHRYMVANELATNDQKALTQDTWMAAQRRVVELRQTVKGSEILADLDSRIVTADVGDFVSTYAMVGGGSNNTSISIDGRDNQAYDHASYKMGGDPNPVFKNGWGISWRKKAGLDKAGFNILNDSSKVAMNHYNEAVVAYYLMGDKSINFGGYDGEGLTTHRNTYKIDLGTGGDYKVDLPNATTQQLSKFFKNLRTDMALQEVLELDVLWVSAEVWANLTQAYALIGDAQAGSNAGLSVLDYVKKFVPAKDIKPSLALKGNQFLGYVRNAITKRVAMPATITALPRVKPQSDFLFEVLSVEGLGIETDALGRKFVFFGTNITAGV